MLTYRGVRIRITANLSSETVQARREWSEQFKEKIKPYHLGVLSSMKSSFKSKGELLSETKKN